MTLPAGERRSDASAGVTVSFAASEYEVLFVNEQEGVPKPTEVELIGRSIALEHGELNQEHRRVGGSGFADPVFPDESVIIWQPRNGKEVRTRWPRKAGAGG